MIRPVAVTAASAAGIVLLLSLKPHDDPSATATSAPSASTPTPAPTTGTSPSGSATAAPEGTGGTAVSGTFEGDTAQTQQGPVQVSVTLAEGEITGIEVLQGVHGQGPSATAVPVLTERAIAAQSADIDAVSGATYTSEGYVSSLQSALDQAGV
ncbi:FMN-binding protein [Streptomyces sp. NPDC059828]|uniref:FMN-binding protein n=1 Tax=Streptomyces sp. NPDC059828 TaxID=3346965 RepID=UPI00365F5DA9